MQDMPVWLLNNFANSKYERLRSLGSQNCLYMQLFLTPVSHLLISHATIFSTRLKSFSGYWNIAENPWDINGYVYKYVNIIVDACLLSDSSKVYLLCQWTVINYYFLATSKCCSRSNVQPSKVEMRLLYAQKFTVCMCYARMLQTMSDYALGVSLLCSCSKLIS